MKKIIIYLLISILALIIVSCRSKKETPKLEPQYVEIKDVLTLSKPNSQKMFTENITNSSLELFKNLSSGYKGENMSFSPVSLNLALGMVYTGTKNNTTEQIHKALGYNADINIFNKEYSDYNKYLNNFSEDTLLDFNLANKIFLEETFKIKEEYEKNITTYFSGAFELADFKKNAGNEEKKINLWVSKITKDKIKDIIPENTLNSSTAMVLVNAIYIKGAWRFQFSEQATKEKEFYSTPDKSSITKFMVKRQKSGIRYAKYKNTQVLELPYKSNNISFMILLPDESTEENLINYIPSGTEYSEICKNLKNRDVHMEIPKFKIESSFDLVKNLMNLGITDIFTNPDLTGISDDKSLKISNILQKVFFEIDENGSEAAAATAIIARTTSVMPAQTEDYINFIADKPFIFILKENKNNTPLFIGQYVNP
ncbi:MAG: serpin family protein [Bacteroidales bacterium]|jgi:serpin B|nr:serpin family protein [Bacteroidales bacterium]